MTKRMTRREFARASGAAGLAAVASKSMFAQAPAVKRFSKKCHKCALGT